MGPSILACSLMAGEGVVNGFTEKLKEVFTGGYYTLLPSAGPTFNQQLFQMVLDKRPDIVFIQIQCGGVLDPLIAKEIAKHSFVMQFSGDIRHTTEDFYYRIGEHIQLTTFSNQRDVDNCITRGIPAAYLELGIDPLIYRPLNIPKVAKDSILMMFNNYGGQFELSGYRAEIVHAIRAAFPEQAGLYGNGWGGIESGNLNHSQVAENYKNNRGLIAISISHYNAQRYNSDRLLRCLASGIFTISHRFPGIELDYEVGKHLVCYDTTEELIELINYYLIHDEERERISEAGCAHAHANFTFLNMAKNIEKLYYQHTE